MRLCLQWQGGRRQRQIKEGEGAQRVVAKMTGLAGFLDVTDEALQGPHYAQRSLMHDYLHLQTAAFSFSATWSPMQQPRMSRRSKRVHEAKIARAAVSVMALFPRRSSSRRDEAPLATAITPTSVMPGHSSATSLMNARARGSQQCGAQGFWHVPTAADLDRPGG